MDALPSGTVTFLFTDVEGSTRLAKQLGPRWPGILAEHQRLLRQAFASQSGVEVDTQGDSFFVAFAGVRDAVGAAIEAQRSLADFDWQGHALCVRMGIHTGEAHIADGRYRGVTVARAARIMAAAHGGQVLLSESSLAVLQDNPIEGVEFRDLGSHKLKDLDRRQHLFQLEAEGLRSSFPAPRVEKPPTPWWRRQAVAAPAALAVAGGIVAGVLALTSGGAAGLRRIDSNSVGRVDPKTGKIVSEVSVGTDPTRLVASDDGSLWVVNYRDETLLRIDPKRGRRTGGARDGVLVDDLAVGRGSVWALSTSAGALLQIDPRFGGVANRTTVCPGGCSAGGGPGPGGVAVGGGWVWATDGSARLDRIDPRNGGIARHRDLDRGAGAVAVGLGFLWVGGPGGVTQVDPTTLRAVQAYRSAGVSRVAVGAGAVWAAAGTAVVKIDPSQGAVVDTIALGSPVSGLAVGAGAVWAVTSSSGTLFEIDPVRGVILRRIRTGGVPTDVAVAAGIVGVSVR
jgi:class 3 adenylate cyclase/streptogramin lyase